jgi:hypothetical protein
MLLHQFAICVRWLQISEILDEIDENHRQRTNGSRVGNPRENGPTVLPASASPSRSLRGMPAVAQVFQDESGSLPVWFRQTGLRELFVPLLWIHRP